MVTDWRQKDVPVSKTPESHGPHGRQQLLWYRAGRGLWKWFISSADTLKSSLCSLWECKHARVCVCRKTQVCKCIHLRCSFLEYHLPCWFEKGSLTGLELTNEARLDSLGVCFRYIPSTGVASTTSSRDWTTILKLHLPTQGVAFFEEWSKS